MGVALAIALPTSTQALTRYVSLSGSHTAPYTNWARAATNIQSAIQVSVSGDLVLVTNGTYRVGSNVVLGAVGNRVAITNAVTVRSVNGPTVTVIAGTTSVRCVYLTSNAVLDGFTLTNGICLSTGNITNDRSGGGVWSQPGGVITNCNIVANRAFQWGAGVYGGSLFNSVVRTNNATRGGGGAARAMVDNCILVDNRAGSDGGGGAWSCLVRDSTISNNYGSYGGGLRSCTVSASRVVNNSAFSVGGAWGVSLSNCWVTGNSSEAGAGGIAWAEARNCFVADNHTLGEGGGIENSTVYGCTVVGNSAQTGGGIVDSILFNCIVYYNRAYVGTNYYIADFMNNGVPEFTNTCTTPAPLAGGVITNPPQIAALDNPHLLAASPCIDQGDDLFSAGTDIDAEARVVGSAVDIGCDEFDAVASTGALAVAIEAPYTTAVLGSRISFYASIQGRPLGTEWRVNGQLQVVDAVSIELLCAAAGLHTIELVASNTWGTAAATTQVEVVAEPLQLYVVPNGSHQPPFTNWAMSASNLQAAVDAAPSNFYGVIITVTNGVYSSGGRRQLTSTGGTRVFIDKPLSVRSVNGPQVTHIVGEGGPNAYTNMRCAYVGPGASLSGFTLSDGHANGGAGLEGGSYGGGALLDAEGSLSNCIVTGCEGSYGGGVRGGLVVNCLVYSNSALDGGGISRCVARNSAIMKNRHGGARECSLFNCTVIGNTSESDAAGIVASKVWNCIVYHNYSSLGRDNHPDDQQINYSCTYPLPSTGACNTAEAPGLVGLLNPRLLPDSPLLNRGANAQASGVDLDLEPRIVGAAVDIGCDEFSPASATGTLAAHIYCPFTAAVVGASIPFEAEIQGRATGFTWDWGDLQGTTNQFDVFHAYAATGSYTIRLTATNRSLSVTATSLMTIATTPVYHVRSGGVPQAPFTNWATAATNIQMAIDAAPSNFLGLCVLVSNGVYAAGGTAVHATLSNRVAVTKPLTIRSLWGPTGATIRGAGPAGPTAVRGVYLGEYAKLEGFTIEQGGALTNGAGGYADRVWSGGGVWCERTALVTNCIIVSNSARVGGGLYGGAADHCVLVSNVADFGGGAAATHLSGCLLDRNVAALGGDGGAAWSGSLTNCLVMRNQCPFGSAVADAIVDNCRIVSNSAGALARSAVANSWIMWNQANHAGGGAWQSSLRGCVVAFNFAPTFASGMNGGTAENCTIVFNIGSATSIASAVRDGLIKNSIVVSNWPSLYEGCTLIHCCALPAVLGEGVIDEDPGFVDMDAQDFHLMLSSPCIDSGIYESWMQDAVDLSGFKRLVGGNVDMGAHEFLFQGDLRIQLAGAYSVSDGMMRAQAAPELPLSTPFAIARRTVAIIPSNIVDWVLVQTTTNLQETPSFSRAFMLRTDGVLVDDHGYTNIVIEASRPQFVTVRNRNHLTIASPAAVLTNRLFNCDFTTGPDKYYGGTNAAVEVSPGVWAMRAGDVDGDGVVSPADELIRATQE